MTAIRFVGCVVTGAGRGAAFTQLPWARRQFVERLGIDPHPGTLNLRLTTPGALELWQGLRAAVAVPIVPDSAAASAAASAEASAADCAARCHIVRLRGITAAIVVPEVAGYPGDQVEIIAALPLRETLGLADGHELEVSVPVLAPPRAVIFDVDGTLVDSIGAYHAAASLAAAEFGLRVPGDAIRVALNGGPPFWHLVVPEGRRTPALLAALREATLRHWPRILAAEVGLFPGLADTLDRLRAAGLRLAIYTGSHGESLPPLQAAGLLEHFEVVLTALDVQQRKPHPEGLLLCLERLGLAPGEAIYVGDSVQDIQAAQAAGMAAIGLLSGTADSALLSAAGPERILPDHSRLADILLG
jgi:phosphoglycolate phosphatase